MYYSLLYQGSELLYKSKYEDYLLVPILVVWMHVNVVGRPGYHTLSTVYYWSHLSLLHAGNI